MLIKLEKDIYIDINGERWSERKNVWAEIERSGHVRDVGESQVTNK